AEVGWIGHHAAPRVVKEIAPRADSVSEATVARRSADVTDDAALDHRARIAHEKAHVGDALDQRLAQLESRRDRARLDPVDGGGPRRLDVDAAPGRVTSGLDVSNDAP